MSKDVEPRTTTARAERRSGAELDDEHDPDRARRASNARLRVAQAPDPDALSKAHDAADQAAYEGMFTNILLLAKRMHDAAGGIYEIIRAPADEGGTDKKLEMIRSEWKAMVHQAIRLRIEAGTVKLGPGRMVGRDLEILHGGFLELQQAIGSSYGLGGSKGAEVRIDDVRSELEMLFNHFGASLATSTPRKRDERIEGDTQKLETAAIQASVGSIRASVHAIQLGLGGAASEAQLDEDVGKLIAAVGETWTWLESMPPGRIGRTPTLAKALTELAPVQRTLAAKPRQAEKLDRAGFAHTVQQIHKRVKK